MSRPTPREQLQSVRAFAYIRVSKEREDMISPEIQRDEITRFCADRGWTVLDWFTDLDISGRTDKRPALQDMVDRAIAGEAEAVVFYRLDRFSRNPAHHYALLAVLRNAGVQVDSVHQPYEDSPEGEFRWGLEAVLAQYESLRLGARLRDAHRRLARSGRWSGGRPPFGFRRVEDEQGVRLVANPEEQALRLWIHEVYQRGWGMNRIARELNQRGIPTQKGRQWERATIEVMLTRPIQIGARLVAGEFVFGGNIEPIVPFETYQKTMAAYEARKRAPQSGRPPRVALTGRHVRCATCGSRLYARYAHHSHQLWYQCQGRVQGVCERGVAIQVNRLEPYVAEKLFERLGRTRAPRRHPDPEPLLPVRVAVEECELALGRLTSLYVEGELLEAEYRSARELQLRRLAKAEERLSRAVSRTEAIARADALEEVWEDLGGMTRAQWDALSPQDQRDVYDLVLERVVINPKDVSPRIRIYWR